MPSEDLPMPIKLIALLAGLILAGAAFWWLVIAESPPPPVARPETGYRVPDAAKITEIWISEYGPHVGQAHIGAARQYWDDILLSLSPSERIPDEDVTLMQVFGRFFIQPESGPQVGITLYGGPRHLIFSVGVPKPDAYYYAGDRGEKMHSVLAEAIAHSIAGVPALGEAGDAP